MKNLSSAFKIKKPFTFIFLIISDFAFAISKILLKFFACAYEIFVIIPISGFTIFDKKSISPFYPFQFQKLHNYYLNLN